MGNYRTRNLCAKVMKEHLIAFLYGMIAIMLVVFIFWILLMLVGQEMIVVGLLMIVTWGVGISIRDKTGDKTVWLKPEDVRKPEEYK
jgi:hypothetical protein